MQEGQPAVADKAHGAGEHGLRLGREAGDQVGPEDDVGAQLPHLRAEGSSVGAGVAPLHALEDHVVAGLQGEVQVRHQARLLGDSLDQVRVGFNLVDGGEAQAPELGHVAQDLVHEPA